MEFKQRGNFAITLTNLGTSSRTVMNIKYDCNYVAGYWLEARLWIFHIT